MHRFIRFRCCRLLLAATFLSNCFAAPAVAQHQLLLTSDMVLDSNALLMPRNATYGPAINGSSYQTEALLSVGDYQYATWYHHAPDEEYMYVGRRNLAGNTWELMDTQQPFINGDAPAWNAHNVISMGVDGDGRMHFSYDHHNNYLNYRNTEAGAATGGSWGVSLLNSERNVLNSHVADPPPTPFNDVTYPRFIADPNSGNLLMTFRNGVSGNGDVYLATYDTATDTWSAPHQFISGQAGIYTDALGSSGDRNAYLNGLDIDASGRLHTTWTWRESAGGSNHDILYAYSDDGGDTWKNNDGAVVGQIGSPITLDSPGIVVVPMDRRNTLMNQQAQIVDPEGRVHTVMWHATDANANTVSGFTTTPAAYYHYYRATNGPAADWIRNELPTERAVGSRPDLASDADGNLYAAYVSPGPGDGAGVAANYYTNGDLVIAMASKATGWQDWEVVYTDTRDFAGEPQLDHARLLNDGVVSIYLQENGANVGAPTGTALRVLEFDRLAHHVIWVGDDDGQWNLTAATNWDSQGDDLGDSPFANGYRVTFDDGAATYLVDITDTVAPSSIVFRNTSAHAYTLSGGGIAGDGTLRVAGGGSVTLDNVAATYTGLTTIEQGTLALSGASTIASSEIVVDQGAILNVARLDVPLALGNGQMLVSRAGSSVMGNVYAAAGSRIEAAGTFSGNLMAMAGATISVGGKNAIFVSGGSANGVLFSDDFGGNGGPLDGASEDQQGAEWSANSAFFDDGNLAEFLEGGALLEFHPEPNTTYSVSLDVNNPSPDWLALGFGRDPIENPGASSFNDRHSNNNGIAWMLYRNNGQANAVESFTGLNTAGSTALDTTGVDFLSPTELRVDIATAADGQSFLAEWYLDGVLRRSETVNIPIDDINYVGISYNDPQGFSAWQITIDNFLLTGTQEVSIVGAANLIVAGDLQLVSDATLAMDIGLPDASDRVAVAGHLHAGGLLEVTLAEGAPEPQLADAFDLFDFASASGEFDAFDLPPLGSGLAWDTTQLLASGVLRVGLAGDYNGDGSVNLADYNVWRDRLGGNWISNRQPQLVGPVGIDDYLVWKANLGNARSFATSANTAVPEPGAWLSVMVGFAAIVGWRVQGTG